MRAFRLFAATSLVFAGLAGPVLAQAPAAPASPAPAPAPAVNPTAPTATPPPATATDAAAPAPATPPAPVTPAVPAGPPAPPKERVDFQLKFPADQGGGTASGTAEALDFQTDTFAVLTGDVDLKYQDLEIHADRAEVDLKTRLVTAQGNVILDQGPRRLTGVTLRFSLKSKTGALTEATGHVAPDYYFRGAEVEKTGPDTYTVTDGLFTSCDQPVPDWSFRLGRAELQIEGYARIHQATMRAKKLPVLYTPYILWPVKRERTSGFLIPNIGYSNRRGASLGLAYFQTLGRSYDTTFHFDTYSRGYLGLGDELRYRPSEGTRGNLLAYVIRDPKATDKTWRWKLEWNHTTTDLPWGMRGVVAARDYSDFNFFRDFEHDLNTNTLRFIDSRAFVSGGWGPHLLNIELDNRETFITQNNTVKTRKLPDIEYRLRSTRLGKTPLYLEFQGSASYLGIDRPDSYSGNYGRVDAFPQLTLPIRSFPWLSLSLSAGERFTYYSDTVNPATQRFDGTTVSRSLPTGSAQIVGPSFSRIFNSKIGSFGKFKHVIEPRFTYTYQGNFDDFARVPQIDEVDFARSTNQGRVALTNRVLGKTGGEKGSAREIFLFELARNVSFDAKQPLQSSIDGKRTTQSGPLEGLIRFNPSDKLTLKEEVTYDTLVKGLSSSSFGGNVNFSQGNQLGLTWFTRYQVERGETLGNQLRLFGAVSVVPNRLRFEGQVSYDLKEKFLQQQRYILSYSSQCFGLRLEMREFRTIAATTANDKEFRFSLTLKNVGTFLDLTSRTSGDPQAQP